MTIASTRLTTLQIVNEVRRRRGLQQVSTLGADSQSISATDILNSVISEISDYGDWNETLVTANVTTQSSVRDYTVRVVSSGSEMAAIKTVKDIYFGVSADNLNGTPLNFISQNDMRLFDRYFNPGEPRQFTVFGTDSSGNPIVRVTPTPVSAQGMGVLSCRVHTIPPLYTTSDNTAVVPFNSRMVVQGLLAACILDEEGGSQTDHYQREYTTFQNMLKLTYNRFTSDVGRYRRFVPGSRRFRRNLR